MHSKTRIAALITALALGAQAGFAATVESATPGTVVLNVETVEPAAIKELPGSQAVKPETATSPIPATASAPPVQAHEPATIRGWFSSLWDRITGAFRSAPAALSSAQAAFLSPAPAGVFPQGSDSGEEWAPLPAQRAYLERIEAQRAHLVANGDAFPVGSVVESWLLPVQVAYFERLEQQRLASLAPQPVPHETVASSSRGDGAQARNAELTMLQDANTGSVQ